MMNMAAMTVPGARRLRGQVIVPGDKSISHRSLLLGAIAQGRTIIQGFLPSADCFSTLGCLKALGVNVELQNETTVAVHGAGLRGLREPLDVLDCGNSGTTLRLLAGILAGQRFSAVLTGDASLRSRPMGRIVEPLRAMGATVLGRQGGALAPLTIVGASLRGMEHNLPVASAQVKSCLLLAALYADSPTTVLEPVPSRDHTERMLRAQGVQLRVEGTRVTIIPSAVPLAPMSVTIPGDISSAAYFLAAAAILPGSAVRLTNVGVNPSRTGFLDVLQAMGARVTVENRREVSGEPVADLAVQSSELVGLGIGGKLIPRLIDELPIIAVIATQARGLSTVRDAQELRVKESNRIAALVSELGKLGAQIEERPDGFAVEGPTPLRGTVVESHGDHRLGLSLAIAGLAAAGETTVLGAECIAVSYPGFERALKEALGP